MITASMDIELQQTIEQLAERVDALEKSTREVCRQQQALDRLDER